MGKKSPQVIPRIQAITPKLKIQAVLSAADFSLFFKTSPISIPNKPVATAGRVLNMPSGSQVVDDFQVWFSVRINLSIHAARLVSFSRFGAPNPGTGTKVISIQYTTRILVMIIN